MQMDIHNDVVMDFTKAFVKVTHNRLLYKLSLYGNTLGWIGGRSQRIVLGGKSSSIPVLSGVP